MEQWSCGTRSIPFSFFLALLGMMDETEEAMGSPHQSGSGNPWWFVRCDTPEKISDSSKLFIGPWEPHGDVAQYCIVHTAK